MSNLKFNSRTDSIPLHWLSTLDHSLKLGAQLSAVLNYRWLPERLQIRGFAQAKGCLHYLLWKISSWSDIFSREKIPRFLARPTPLLVYNSQSGLTCLAGVLHLPNLKTPRVAKIDGWWFKTWNFQVFHTAFIGWWQIDARTSMFTTWLWHQKLLGHSLYIRRVSSYVAIICQLHLMSNPWLFLVWILEASEMSKS